jgi:hypothetical protein
LQTFETQKERTKRKNNVMIHKNRICFLPRKGGSHKPEQIQKKITIFFETEMHHNHFSKTLSCHTNLKAK